MRKAVGFALLIVVLSVVPLAGLTHPPDGQDVVHCHVDNPEDAALYVTAGGAAVGVHGSQTAPEPYIVEPGGDDHHADDSEVCLED